LRFILLNIFIYTVIFFSCSEKVYSQEISNDIILVTDNKGNIIEGNKKDWTYNDKSYNKIIGYENLFEQPLKDTLPDNPPVWKVIHEIIGNKLVLKWNTPKGFICKGFAIERKEISPDAKDTAWIEIAYVKGRKDPKRVNRYSYIDKKLKEGEYKFRLRMESENETAKYLNLNQEIFWLDFPTTLQFYPVFPNPVKSKFNLRFFLPSNDEISIFFAGENDTLFVLKKLKLRQGFYEIALDKSSFNFNNEYKTVSLIRNKIRSKVYTRRIKFE